MTGLATSISSRTADRVRYVATRVRVSTWGGPRGGMPRVSGYGQRPCSPVYFLYSVDAIEREEPPTMTRVPTTHDDETYSKEL